MPVSDLHYLPRSDLSERIRRRELSTVTLLQGIVR